MCILSSLFKKKTPPPRTLDPAMQELVQHNQEILQELINTPSISFSEPSYSSTLIKPFSAQEIEQHINNNPLSVKYRLEKQHTTAHMHSMAIEEFISSYKGRFVSFDLETTGLNDVDDKIVEISAVKVKDNNIVDTYHQYVNPNILMPEAAKSINHITDDMLLDQPYIFDVLPNLLDFLHNEIIVAHNCAFDYRFLAQSCLRYRFKIPRKWFDSIDLKPLWPNITSRKLQCFLDAAGIINENAHSAIGDASALAKLMIVSIEKYNG